MSVIDTRWQRVRRRFGPITRRVPYGHVVTGAATYARLVLPGLRPGRRFVIFAQGRSGSTLLTELLNSHPQVYCADEILTWKRAAPVRYARACSIGHRADVYGFKVKLYQLTVAQQIERPATFLRQMRDDGWQVLHLQRRNVLRQALSAIVAERRDVYHLAVGATGPKPVHIDPEELLRRADQRAQFSADEHVALEGVDHLSLVYEDDLLTPELQQQTAERAFTWLGLDAVPATVRLRRIVEGSWSSVVANADEVAASVAHSRYADLLSED